jgi:hypothetical protein
MAGGLPRKRGLAGLLDYRCGNWYLSVLLNFGHHHLIFFSLQNSFIPPPYVETIAFKLYETAPIGTLS